MFLNNSPDRRSGVLGVLRVRGEGRELIDEVVHPITGVTLDPGEGDRSPAL